MYLPYPIVHTDQLKTKELVYYITFDTTKALKKGTTTFGGAFDATFDNMFESTFDTTFVYSGKYDYLEV
jgi:hypothetical protein